MRHALLKITILPFLLYSCSNDDGFETSGFDPITEAMLFQTLSPAENYEYFEFRNAECGLEGPFQTIYSEGEKCSIESEPNCVEEIDALRPEFSGYDTSCLPACCSEYVVAQLNGMNILFDTVDELNAFLGPIDTVSDALILVDASGYYFQRNNIGKSGIKKVPGGYEIIALRTTAFCDPIITTQYLLLVSESGVIEIMAEREEKREDGICI